METISHFSFSSSPLLRKQKTQHKTSFQFQFCKRKTLSKSSYLHSCPRLKAQFVNNIFSIATEEPHVGGDLSVLLHVAALFLFMYWISNFVVPEYLVKDWLKEENSEKNSGA